jgi:hypothetical protein
MYMHIHYIHTYVFIHLSLYIYTQSPAPKGYKQRLSCDLNIPVEMDREIHTQVSANHYKFLSYKDFLHVDHNILY